MRIALGTALLVIACGSEPALEPRPLPPTPQPQPAPTPIAEASPAPACEKTIAAAAKRIATESKRVALDTAIERTHTVMIASCETEAWPANVMTCIAAARLDADLEACTEELTYRQHKRLHDKIAAIMPKRVPTTVAVGRRRADDLMIPGELEKSDCTSRIVDARSAECRQQYCKAHASDPRCMIE
jgi:hypothetical protein